MGFPAVKFEGFYRNHIDEVVKFFELNHRGNYKIYNLCRERDFDTTKFSGPIVKYPFDDHNPPAFKVLYECIEDITEFLSSSPKNVVAINCKAGKGRTGVIVCCSMIRSNISKDANSALRDYGTNRTYNGKGVTIPSQIRYIFYYDHFIKNNLQYVPTTVWLRTIKFEMAPNISNPEMEYAIFVNDAKVYLSKTHKITKINRMVIFSENVLLPLKDDIKFQFFHRFPIIGPKVLCQCWLNTFFIVNQPSVQFLNEYLQNDGKVKNKTRNPSEIGFSLTSHDSLFKVFLTRSEIDMANKDNSCKIFPENFGITFLFSIESPNTTHGSAVDISQNNNSNMTSQLEDLWETKSSQYFNLTSNVTML